MSLVNQATKIILPWTRSIATYGATAGIGLIYFTDWRVIAEYIPLYNGKFKVE